MHKGESVERYSVIGDSLGIKNFVSEKRENQNEIKHSVIGIDDGKNMLKITWNYISSYDKYINTECKTCDKKFEKFSQHRDHMTTVHLDNEDSGAKKSIVLFAAMNTKESHSNLALAMSEINLDKIDYKLSMDLKCSNIVNGLQTHSSRHPCAYGHCKKLKNGLWEQGKLRTVEEINKINKQWIDETNADPSKLKEYFNCKNASLLKENGTGETKVLEMCPPPPLHTAKLGPINDLMVLLERECPEEAKQFLIDNYITKEGYHGGELASHMCATRMPYQRFQQSMN